MEAGIARIAFNRVVICPPAQEQQLKAASQQKSEADNAFIMKKAEIFV